MFDKIVNANKHQENSLGYAGIPIGCNASSLFTQTVATKSIQVVLDILRCVVPVVLPTVLKAVFMVAFYSNKVPCVPFGSLSFNLWGLVILKLAD